MHSAPGLMAGAWERGVPAGGGDLGDPAEDADGSGQCYVTGLADGDNDVDGGSTAIYSPVMDASDPDAILGYWRWYSTMTDGSPSDDVLSINVSDDGGLSWTNLETIGPGGPETDGGWIRKEFRVAEVASGSTKATGVVPLDFTGSHAHFTDATLSSEGVVE